MTLFLYLQPMSLGWLWFFLGVAVALVVAAAQQLVPTDRAFWFYVLLSGIAVAIVSLALYRPKNRK
ncbi:MAG: hypothetical protein JSR60_01710 [Proteobacteria bacterium]|nr:hypothetical protein [Pseudomonadota bacterium]